MTTVPLALTGTSKANILDMMFEHCGVSGFVFERTADENNSALRKLNFLMARLLDQGIDLGYTFPAHNIGNPEELSGIPDSAVEAISLELALVYAPAMGKTLSPEARTAHARDMALLRSQYATILPGALPLNTPLGAGARLSFGQFASGSD